MEQKKIFLKIGKYVLIFLLPILLYKLLLYPWGDEYEQKSGIVEYNYYTATGRKGSGKIYCNIKFVDCDTIFGYYKRYDSSNQDAVRKAERIDEGDTICIYFRNRDFCDYTVMRMDNYSVSKEEIENSEIINISGISSQNKFILDPKERKYYDPFYALIMWLKSAYLVMAFSSVAILLILLLVSKIAPNFLKTVGEEARRKKNK